MVQNHTIMKTVNTLGTCSCIVSMFEEPEAVARGCSVKEVFLKTVASSLQRY